MQRSPSWVATRPSSSQEIPRISRNPKIYYRIHKYPPHVPILTHTDPIHTPTSHFQNVHPNIILPSKPVFSTKPNLYPVNSLAAAAVNEPALYRLLTFQIQDLTSIAVAQVVPKYQSRSEDFVNYS